MTTVTDGAEKFHYCAASHHLNTSQEQCTFMKLAFFFGLFNLWSSAMLYTATSCKYFKRRDRNVIENLSLIVEKWHKNS